MQRREFVRFLAFSGVAAGSASLNASSAHPSAPSVGELQAKANEMLEEIFRNNGYYRRSKGNSFFAAFKESQHPRVTLVGCSDSRFQVGAVDSSSENDIFVIRNIGNQFGSNPGSVEYGVRHLHTPLLIFVGHSRCEAVKAAMGDYSKESLIIKKEIDSLHSAIKKAKEGSDEIQRWLNCVISNVHEQVCNAKIEFEEEVKSGKLTIVGMVYDLANDMNEGYGNLKIINVNGETDVQKIKQMPVFKNISL